MSKAEDRFGNTSDSSSLCFEDTPFIDGDGKQIASLFADAPAAVEFSRVSSRPVSAGKPKQTKEGRSSVASVAAPKEEPKETADSSSVQDETKEEKNMRRIMANRKSAKESRQRRRQLVTKLSATVDQLSAENLQLRQSNTEMRNEIHELKRQLLLTLTTARGVVSRGLGQQEQEHPQRSGHFFPGNTSSPSNLPAAGMAQNSRYLSHATIGGSALPSGPFQGSSSFNHQQQQHDDQVARSSLGWTTNEASGVRNSLDTACWDDDLDGHFSFDSKS